MPTSLPEHFEDFAEARREGFLKVKELKDKGEKICGAFCQYTPSEIIYAAGLYQVALCGRSPDPIKTAETRLPANLCPLIKASYGHALEESCPYAYFSDVVVGETTCDGKKKMYELLGELKPMQVIHLPNVPDYERSLEMWTEEIRAFAKGLEEKFNVTITDDMLNESIEWCNKERIQAARIYELGKYDPPAITGTKMNDIMEGEQYMFDREAKYNKINEILDQCEKNWHDGIYPYEPDPNRPRLIVSGGGYGGVSAKTINVMEELGGAIVCYEGCCGISSRRRLVDEDRSRDPYVRIAEKYIEVPCAVVSPNYRRMDQVRETIKEWHADGYVSITLHSCNPFAIETENIRRVCEEMDIPLLHIETDFYPGDAGQIRTRIEAFLEMIRMGKEAAHE
ncbi:2-hydroxyacyl-CoA dehydratase family protein [bacterium]|uniref:double-cubane-cluster-containing anaerobic reductase n=1 Tax=unclassified Bariatricus TaxID=2677046 RepID=UPI002A2A89B9|nr:2-hydroxyacyl-CoA dehydratase family protein [bacterium]MDD6515345.1 double-cubane-cluster-containing anaerobic reductase [bacterium]MDY4502702.1 double-cubane-cluster-containing anaerobic reductase [Bariatricus sp.]